MARPVIDELPDQPRLLIVCPATLSDVARSVPVLVSLGRARPDARIDWLIDADFTDAIAHHPMLHRTVPFDRDALRGRTFNRAARAKRKALKRTLRGQRYDAVLDLRGHARSGLLSRLSGATLRIGDAHAPTLARLRDNRRLKPQLDPSPGPTHTVDRLLGLVRAMGIDPAPDLSLYVGPEDQAWWAGQRESGGIGTEPYVVLAPTAKCKCKRWPAERYTEIARRLLNEPVAVVLLAAPDEREQLEPMAAELEQTEGDRARRLVAPQTTVGQAMAILEKAALVVANDAAPLHLAVGLHRPAVALFGPTDPRKVGPYQKGDAVIQPADITDDDMASCRRQPDDQSVISRIATDAVWHKIVATVQDA